MKDLSLRIMLKEFKAELHRLESKNITYKAEKHYLEKFQKDAWEGMLPAAV